MFSSDRREVLRFIVLAAVTFVAAFAAPAAAQEYQPDDDFTAAWNRAPRR